MEEGVEVIGDGEEGGEEEAAVTAATGPSAAAESARTTSYLERRMRVLAHEPRKV